MTVSYPMYALPKMQKSIDFWWTNVRQILLNQGVIPEISRIDPGDDLFAHWLNPDLFLSQTCGFPLVSILQSQVKLIGTPVYSAPGCSGPNYCSYYVVHKNNASTDLDDFKDKIFAFNEQLSQSGFNAVRVNLFDRGYELPFFSKNVQSGGHRNSILMVANQEADICAVDCVTHSLLSVHQREVIEDTRILSSTKHTPGLPLITSVHTSDDVVEALFHAIKQVCQDKSLADASSSLQMLDIEKVSLSSYNKAISKPISLVEAL